MRIKTARVVVAYFLGFVAGGVLMMGAPFAHAANPFSNISVDYFPENIDSYRVDLVVNQDATVSVTESIKYDFKEEHKHGIYRTIPSTRVPGALWPATYSDFSIVNEHGTPYYVTQESEGRDGVYLKIGDPDTLVTGTQLYTLSYKVKNAIGWFDDRDEIYWNATGNDWTVPIKQVEVHVIIPGVYREKPYQLASYCGPRGSKNPCLTMQPVYHEDTNTTEFVFSTQPESFLSTGDGMTVAVGFPKGILSEPTLQDRVLMWLSRTWFLPVPLIIVALWFRKAWMFSRRRSLYYSLNPIVAQYDAQGYTPLETSFITKGKVDQKDISAEIISLAVRGYVVIQATDEGYSFIPTAKPIDDLPLYDKTLLLGIQGLSTAALKNTFFTKSAEITKTVLGQLRARDLVQSGKQFSIQNRWATLFLALFLSVNPGAFIWLSVGHQAGFIFSASCVLIGLISFIAQPRAVRLTDAGLDAERGLLGLKEYIRVAEADRIAFHNAPEKKPELFEQLLPYAMVFNLEEKWAAEFDGIYTQPPVWYGGARFQAFSATSFTSQMNSFAAVTASSLFSAPPGSSGSGSGSSGGGSSGGGGGGGGGGSW